MRRPDESQKQSSFLRLNTKGAQDFRKVCKIRAKIDLFGCNATNGRCAMDLERYHGLGASGLVKKSTILKKCRRKPVDHKLTLNLFENGVHWEVTPVILDLPFAFGPNHVTVHAI
jgi:hypothetical protein